MLPIVETPKYTLTIPSSKKVMEYRPYLVKEEKILMLALESEANDNMIQALRDVVESCTFGKIDAGRLTMFDIEFIFSYLRSHSVGDKSTIGIKCQSCETTNKVDIDISNVEIRGGSTEDLIEVSPQLKIKLRYPDLNDVQQTNTGSDVEKLYRLLGKCIETVFYGDEVLNGRDHSEEEIQNFIESLPSLAFNKIKMFIENVPYAALDAVYECEHCGHNNKMEVKGLQAFFA